MKLTTLAGLGAALAATVAGLSLLRPEEPAPSGVIYLLDARRDSSGPLEQALPFVKPLEKTYRAKVLVRAAASLSPLRDHEAMFEEFDRTRDATPAPPMFFALGTPYADTKKRLRSAIDERTSLRGTARVRLLDRLIMVRDTERLADGDRCKRLDDDIRFANWNFLGVGLVVQDGSLRELKTCIETLTH